MKEDDDVSAVLEKMTDQRNTGDWRKNFFHVLADNENPSWEYVFAFGTENQYVEAHSIKGIISYLVDDCYFDCDFESSKQMMLFNFTSTKIFEYFSKIKQKATLTLNDQILIALDGKSDDSIDIDISSDTKFLASLWRNDLLDVFERDDVFNLSGGIEKERYTLSNCLKCMLYSKDDEGTYCKADMRNIDHTSEYAHMCDEFLPFPRKVNKIHTYHELKEFNEIY